MRQCFTKITTSTKQENLAMDHGFGIYEKLSLKIAGKHLLRPCQTKEQSWRKWKKAEPLTEEPVMTDGKPMTSVLKNM